MQGLEKEFTSSVQSLNLSWQFIKRSKSQLTQEDRRTGFENTPSPGSQAADMAKKERGDTAALPDLGRDSWPRPSQPPPFTFTLGLEYHTQMERIAALSSTEDQMTQR